MDVARCKLTKGTIHHRKSSLLAKRDDDDKEEEVAAAGDDDDDDDDDENDAAVFDAVAGRSETSSALWLWSSSVRDSSFLSLNESFLSSSSLVS